MDRFVSNTINKVDKKGRVSIPAPFRTALQGQSLLHVILNTEHQVAEAGGSAFMNANYKRLEQMDPFSKEYEIWSFYLLGDADEIKIDGEGRIIISDIIREHTGISDEVAFVGRGNFFQLWAPKKFKIYREEARAQIKQMRKKISISSGGSGLRSGEQGV